jgi:hypothetical protein
VLAVLEVGDGSACDHPRDLQLNGVGPRWPNSRVPWSSSMAMWTWTSSSSPGPQVLLDDVRPSAHCDVLPSGRRPSLLHRGLDRLRTTGPQRHQELHPTVTAYLVIRTRHPSHQHTAYRPAPLSTLPLVAVYRMAAFLPLYARPEIVRGQQCTDCSRRRCATPLLKHPRGTFEAPRAHRRGGLGAHSGTRHAACSNDCILWFLANLWQMAVAGPPGTRQAGCWTRPELSVLWWSPRRNRTGDPILTMNLALTAVRTRISAGRRRPSTAKLCAPRCPALLERPRSRVVIGQNTSVRVRTGPPLCGAGFAQVIVNRQRRS